MSTIRFDRDKTKIVKGFAILFMIILHTLASPDCYDVAFSTFDNPLVSRIFSTFKICVGIFTFMVGYGYSFSKSKDIKYSWEHIRRLLLPFWIILFIFTIPLCKNIDGGVLLQNMFGINSSLNYFSWFVYFFIYAMVVMPFIARVINKKTWMVVLVIGFSFLCEVAVHSIPNWSDNDFIKMAFNCMLQTPCMVVGYLFAKYRLFEKIKLPTNRYVVLLIIATCAICAFIIRYYKSAVLGFSLSVVYVPMLIFSIVALFSHFKLKYTSVALQKLGELSVYMWFFHALFFTKSVRSVYQPLILVSDNVFVVAIWTILLTVVASFVLKSVVDKIGKVVSR